MFGSIERGLDRVRLMLTPRRRQLQRLLDNDQSNGPNIVPNKVNNGYLFNCNLVVEMRLELKISQQRPGTT